MAIYHCSIQVIGRNAGRSSVAAAAYRAGEELVNEYDGLKHDFTKKRWVQFTKIILPDNAPPEYADRSTLWNAVEMAEKSKDAQLCREFELALPQELTREQQIEVVERFVRDKLVSQGMIIDIAIHNPPVTNDRHQPIDINGNVTKDIDKMQFINPHAHILATVRPMDENGKWQKKSEIEYLCRRGGEEKGFTALEFKQAKDEGWKKQYKFADGKKKVWLTAEEGKDRELERMNRAPKTSTYGRKNETVEYWNSKDRIFEWRQYWEKVVNDEFEYIRSEIRIDSRSFKEQGREDELPTIHMGPAATNMEKRVEREMHEGKPEVYAVHSDIGNINRQIKEHNKFVRELKAKIDIMVVKAKDFIEGVARKMEGIRAKIIGNTYEESVLAYHLGYMTSKIVPEGERLEKYRDAIDKAEKANKDATKEVKELKQELDSCSPLQFAKKNNLQKRIQELQEKIEDYKEYMTSISRMCGYASEKEYQVAKEEYAIKYKAYSKMQEAVNKIKKDTQGLTSIYESEIIQIEPADAQKVEDKREIFRSEMEGVVKSELQDKYGNNFDEGKFGDACSIIDKRLKLAQSDINMKEQHRSKQSVKDDEKDKVAEHAVEKKHRIHR